MNLPPEHLEELVKQALELPASAREYLAERLLESLTPADNPEANEAILKEAKRRASEIDSGVRTTISGADVLTRLRSQFAR